MKKQTRKVQIIAFVLAVMLLLNIPLPVMAQASIENAIEEQQNQPVLLTDRLTETETYWQNADGSITYEQHMEPIRYQDETGAWHEIENDVVQIDKSEESTDPFKNEGYAYRSESSKNWVLLKDSLFEEDPIKVQNGERRRIHPSGADAANANRKNSAHFGSSPISRAASRAAARR